MRYSVFSGVLPELSAEEVCARLARHGYDGVEWRVNGEYHWRAATIDRDAARIGQLCAEHGLAVAGLMTYVRPDEEAALRRLIDACQALGCPRFRIFSALYDPAVGYFALRDQTRARLERLARLLEGTGVKALLEIHFGTIFSSPALAYELLRDIDPDAIGVILDPANLVIEGGMDLRMALDMIGPYVDLVHVKNIRSEQTPQGRWRWRFDELAAGMCDWAAVCLRCRRPATTAGCLSRTSGGYRSATGATSPRTWPTPPCRRATSTSASPRSSPGCAVWSKRVVEQAAVEQEISMVAAATETGAG